LPAMSHALTSAENRGELQNTRTQIKRATLRKYGPPAPPTANKNRRHGVLTVERLNHITSLVSMLSSDVRQLHSAFWRVRGQYLNVDFFADAKFVIRFVIPWELR
jgi:hypothetical protein